VRKSCSCLGKTARDITGDKGRGEIQGNGSGFNGHLIWKKRAML